MTIGWDAFTLEQSGGLPVLNYLVKSDQSDFIFGTPVLNAVSTIYSKMID